MNLFLRVGDVCVEIANITLRDGCIPSVGNQAIVKGTSNDQNAYQVEPALWFKVLVLDSVSIDCTKRAIMWNCDSALSPIRDVLRNGKKTSSAASLNRRKRISESMYIGGECSGYESDLDELFTSIQQLVKKYESSSINTDDFNDSILRILHCHVLPSIKMAVEDLPQVENIFRQQEEAIRGSDIELSEKNNEMERVMISMGKQQEKFINELLNPGTATSPYPVEFAKKLHADIEQNCKESSQNLEDLQGAVQKAKERLAAGEQGNLETTIEEKRKLRNECFERHQRLLTAREILRDYISKALNQRKSITQSIRQFTSRRSGMVFDDPLHNIYVEMHNKLREVKDCVKDLVDKKVRMISVKEALRATIEELREGQESMGFDVHRHGKHRATDVLRQSCIPREWLTLTEQVSSIFNNENHAITKAHHNFCKAIIEQCSAALFEKQLADLSNLSQEDRDKRLSCGSGSSDEKVYSESILEIKDRVQSQETMSFISGASLETMETSSFCSSARDSQSVASSIRDSSSQSDYLSFGGTFNRQSEPVNQANESRRDSLLQLEGVLGNDEIVIIHDTEKNHLKVTVDKIRQDIRQHFENMTLDLQDELVHTTEMAYKNIWLKYEVHFYEITMPYIIQLYEAAYFNVCERLCRSTSDLTASDLDLCGSVLAELLQNESQVPTPEVFSPTESEAEEIKSPGAKVAFRLPPEGSEKVVLSESPMSEDQEEELSAHINNNEYEKGSFMRHFSEPPPSKSSNGITNMNQNIKKVTIHYPSSVTMIYNRRTWPLLRAPSLEEAPPIDDSVEFGVDVLTLNNAEADANSQMQNQVSGPAMNTIQGKQVLLLPKFREMFQPAIDCLRAAIQDNIPLLKLQHLTKCLREINTKLSEVQHQEFQEGIGACSDELIDMLVILLCNCDVKDSARLYPHLMLLTDLIPPFFEGGPYSFALVQFAVAYQFVQDRLVLRKRMPIE